ncbi:MAG: hypothetical protein ACKOWF_08530 [Chloroflexota bacterium]
MPSLATRGSYSFASGRSDGQPGRRPGRRAVAGLVLVLTGLIAVEEFFRVGPGRDRHLAAPAVAAPVNDDASLNVLAPRSDTVDPAGAAGAAAPAPAPDAAFAPVAEAPALAAALAPAVAGAAPQQLAAVTAPAPPAAPGGANPAVAAPASGSGNPPERLAAMAGSVAMGGLLPANRILTYYGHPHDPNMGILGEYEKEELLQILREEAARYAAADPTRPVIPAFEVIATVAQNWPTPSGHYLLDTDMKTLQEYADFTEANGILLFLDLQIGRNTVPAEIAKVLPLLERPHVHLALDPEFAIAEGQTPGTHIGEVTAGQIAEAQAILSRLVMERNLPPKILIVHQFREDMILGKQELQPYPGVQVVIESDGFGKPSLKKQVYRILITNDEYEYSGIKHFYRQDTPVMTAAETVALDPSPHLVIYQ